MQSRDELKAELEAIKDTALANNNPHKLSFDEKRYLTIVLNTLIYMLDNMDFLRNLGYCYFPDGDIAPIHFENYARNGQPLRGQECEDYIKGSLHQIFITIFNNLKGKGGEHIKIFCSKMNSNCIDARTREAFDYGLQFSNNLPFTDMFNFCIKKLPTSNQDSYAWVVSSVVNNIWGKEYIADRGENAIAKHEGIVNEAAFGLEKLPQLEAKDEEKESPDFGLINNYLRNYNQAIPNSDFLMAYKTVKPEMLEVFFKILLSQPEYLENILVAMSAPANVANPNLLKKYNAIRRASQEVYDKFILENYVLLITMAGKGDISTALIKKLMQNTSPIILLEIWKKPEFSQVIGEERNQKAATTLVDGFIIGIEADETCLKEFFNTPLASGNTVIHFATQSDNPELIKKAIITAQGVNIDIWQPNQVGDSPIVYAVKNARWEAVKPLIMEEKGNNPEADQIKRTEYGKALLYTTGHEQWKISKQLLEAHARTDLFHPDTHASALHHAANSNQIDIINLITLNGTNINQTKPHQADAPTAVIIAAASARATDETLVYLITHEDFDVKAHNQGMRALSAAAKANQKEKLIMLLTLKGMDVETAKNTIGPDAPAETLKSIKLFGLIKRLLDNKLAINEDTNFLRDVTQKEIDEILGLILNVQTYTTPQINRAKFAIKQTRAHLEHGFANVHLNFGEHEYTNTTAALNVMLTLAHNSNDPSKFEWEGQIKEEAYSQLVVAVRAEPDLQKRKSLLLKAKEEKIFTQHRSQSLLFSWGKTTAKKNINILLEEVEQELKLRA